MTTAYSPLLGLALPVTGELAGTWGDTVNDYITSYLDSAVAGTQTISGSQTAVTLSKTTNAALSQAGTGATGSSQYSVINCTGNPASMLTVTVPAASKTYVVVNATSTNQDVKIVGAGPTTGVTLVAGERAIIAWNGSDFIKVASSTVDGVSTISFGSTGLTPSTATSGAVTVAGTLAAGSGGTGQSTYTSGDLLYATGATALSKLGIGTNGQILTSTGTAPQWSTLSGVAVTTFSAGTTGFTPNTPTSGAITLGGTLATTNGGTGLTSFTANRVFYASSTSAIAQSANLTFDGTTLTANNFTDSSLTSGRVTYATTGGNLTDSANLLYSGTDLTVYGITVGRGAGAVSTNTAVGASALAANTTGSENTAVGALALRFNTTGVANTAFGQNALATTTTSNYNTALGARAMQALTTGSYNVAVGSYSLYVNTTGASNVAIGGYGALLSNTTGSNSVAVGDGALYSNTSASNNTAVGYQAGYSNQTGTELTVIGTAAGYSNTGTLNTFVGSYSGYWNTSGGSNTALGQGAFQGQTGSGTGSFNTAIGRLALFSNTTASNNTAVGYQALYANTTATGNTAVGAYALDAATTGGSNTAVGIYALTSLTTGVTNSAVGEGALISTTTGSYNTALGYQSLQANTTASNNTAVGYQAGYSNTTGTINLFVGNAAGYRNTTGGGNSFVGSYAAGYNNTTGANNTAVGQEALAQNTTASNNTAVGYQAGYSNTTGYSNAILGQGAGYSTTTGYENTSIGQGAAYGNTTGYGNVALGLTALNTASTANLNTALGYRAGYSVTTGGSNTFVGQFSGYSMTTGTKNTILGSYNGNQGGLDIRTANNYIVLSDGDGNPRLIGDGSGNWVAGGTSTSTRFSAIGTPTITALSASIPNDPNGQSAATLTIGANTNGGVWAGGGYGLRIIDKTSNSGSSQTGYGLYVSAPYDGVNASGSAYALTKYGIYVDDIYSFYGINAAANTTNWGLFIKGGGYNHMANPLLLGTTTPVSGGGKLQVSDGITFPATQSASSNANTLDDYEEGTWTPTLDFRISSTGGLNYLQRTGRYIKIGGMVHISVFLTWNANNFSASSGVMQLMGLPFAAASNSDYRGGLYIAYSANCWTGLTIYQSAFRSENSETNAIFNFSDAADGQMNSTFSSYTNLASSGEIMISGCYPVL